MFGGEAVIAKLRTGEGVLMMVARYKDEDGSRRYLMVTGRRNKGGILVGVKVVRRELVLVGGISWLMVVVLVMFWCSIVVDMMNIRVEKG